MGKYLLAYDLTIHEKTLRRDGLRKSDFRFNSDLSSKSKLNSILARSVKIGETGFSALNLGKSSFGGKPTYKLKNFSDELVLRLISKNIQRLTGVRQSNRMAIAKAMNSLLQEGFDCRIYKLDIKSFYENVCITEILKNLDSDSGFSRSSFAILETFFEELKQQQVAGLPRGVALSATLAEFVMRTFDENAISNSDVFYYARFVDDIFIITSSRENPANFLKELKKNLPSGLQYNARKTKHYELLERPAKKTEAPAEQIEFNFLGYNFNVHQRQKNDLGTKRNVHIDISQSKTNKIKTKVIRSFIQFCRDGDWDDLIGRLKLLTGNYVIFDHARGIRRKAGIYYNYQMVDVSSSISLPQLDNFLKSFVLSKQGKLCSELRLNLNDSQRRTILKLSFVRGFRNRDFYHFTATDLVRLMGCWKYA